MNNSMKKPIVILMVEDNDGDVLLTQEALLDGNISNRIIVAKHGQAAIDYLEKVKKDNVDVPDLILMDINLPLVNGHEAIAYIRQDDALKNIPIFIFSSSSAPSDLEKSKPFVQHYLTKPLELDKFMEGIRKINQFSLCIVKE